jgi:serine/threonine protein kinase
MLPVAEYNLADYLEEVVQDDEKRSFLPSFFGCLSRGLWHIHQQKLRHRDIKPENILVSNNKVLFTDFDCAHDWSHTLHSTTIGVPPRTQEYASPEVAYSGFQKNPQVNSSSDIWSLGCVFLEIINVWKKQSAVELDSLRRSGYYNNLNGIHDHLDKLRTITTKPSITGVLEWIQGMLQENPKLRPTAQRLVEMTSNFCCIECKAHDNRLIMDGETAVSSQTADLEGMRNPENEKTWDRDTYEMSAQPTEAKLRGPHESNVINAVCRDMGRNPLSLSEEHRALILATYNFVLKKVVGLNEI